MYILIASYITATDRRALAWMLENGSKSAITMRKEFELKPSNELPELTAKWSGRANDSRLLSFEREEARRMLAKIEKAKGEGLQLYRFWAMDKTYRGSYYVFA